MCSYAKRSFLRIFFLGVCGALLASTAHAAPLYNPGDTLDPSCSPTNPDCTVSTVKNPGPSFTATSTSGGGFRFGTNGNVDIGTPALSAGNIYASGTLFSVTGSFTNLNVSNPLTLSNLTLTNGTSTNLFATNAGFTNLSFVNATGSGNGNSGPDLTLGSNAPSGILYSVGEDRSVSGTALYFDTFHDENTVNVGTGGYASFDSAATINGTSLMNHTASFQNRMVYNNTGGIGQINGFVQDPVINASATLVNGFHVYDAHGTGSVSTYTGLYCDSLSFASSSYCVYSAGSEPSYFGGSLTSGGAVSASTFFNTGSYALNATYGLYGGTTAGADSISVGTASSGGAYPWIIASGDGITKTGGYLSLKTDGTEQMNISDSGVGVGTSAPYETLQVQGGSYPFAVAGASGLGLVAINNPNYMDLVGINPARTSFNDINLRTGGTNLYLSNSPGYAGIGTKTPSSTLQVVGGSAATSTITLGESFATKGGCLKIQDVSGGTFTYITTQGGVLTASTTPCDE